jgi:hypothetical protein
MFEFTEDANVRYNEIILSAAEFSTCITLRYSRYTLFMRIDQPNRPTYLTDQPNQANTETAP